MKLTAIRAGSVAATAAILLALPSLAYAADGPVSPDAGPVRGGETVTVTGPQGVTFTELHTGGVHTMATGSDGNMYAWGYNSAGQLGTGGTENALTPAPVIAPEGVKFTDLEPGGFHTLALGDDGNLYAWGENERGQLGTGDLANVLKPQKVNIPGDPRIVQISGGEYDSLALADDGTAYGWGYNWSGQTGTGAAESVVLSPLPVLAPDGVKFASISAATHHSLALTADGAAYAWGTNGQGTLGDGTTTNSRVPVAVKMPDGVTFTKVDAGGNHSLGLGSNGQVYAWGAGGYGQLGTGSTDPSLVPIPVSLPAGVRLTDVEANSFVEEAEPAERESESAGGYHSLALGEDGTTWAWGGNQNGQIGNGTTANALTPVRVHTPEGVKFTSLGTGLFHSTALGDDGKAYAWGYNVFGQLGTGDDVDAHEPKEILMAPTVTEVAFDGIAGSDLQAAAAGTWTVVTPEHAAGPVDVRVSWTQFGVEQPPVVHAGGYTYVEPTITGPADATAKEGSEVSFVATTTGSPAPEVTWEVSHDGGKTWVPADSAWKVTVSGNTSTLSATAAKDLDGALVRATATDTFGQTAVSDAATLTVTEKDGSGPSGPNPTDPGTKPPTTTPGPNGKLPTTGAGSAGVAAAIAAGCMALGASALWFRRLAKRGA